MQEDGDDLSKARDIDFNYIFPKEEEAVQFSDATRRLGYERVSHKFWAEKKVWDVLVVVFMLPTHSEITRVEQRLDAVAREFFGRADGWGCLAQK